MTVREDEERGLETQGRPPALPPEAIRGDVNATAAHDPQKPTNTRVAVVAATLLVIALQLAWIVALVVGIVHIVS